MAGSKPMESQMALAMINQFGDKAALMASGAPALFTVNQQSVSVHNPRYIEFLLPGVIAMAIMQMSVFSVAFVFAQYKERGILKRLLATPMQPMQFVTANILTRLAMSVTQAVLFVVLGMVMFHINVAGPFWVLGMCCVVCLDVPGIGLHHLRPVAHRRDRPRTLQCHRPAHDVHGKRLLLQQRHA